MKVSKRFLDRAKPALRRYQRVLENARARDVNESDTCVIVSDFLADVLGYGKYSEVTTEFAIRSTFCDLAIKLDGHVQYLIEVKPVGTELRDNHLRQAVDYAANQGVEWVLLTNGISWQAHRLRFEQPIQNEEVFTVNLIDDGAKPGELLSKLYLISREAAGSAALGSYFRQKEATSRYVVAQLLINDAAVSLVRRQLRKLFPQVRLSEQQIADAIRADVLKRELLEGDRASAAEKLVRKLNRVRAKPKSATSDIAVVTAAVAQLPSAPVVPHAISAQS